MYIDDSETNNYFTNASYFLWYFSESHTTWLAPLLLAIFMCLTPLWCYVAHKNKYTHEVLYSGWTPVIGAMVISRYDFKDIVTIFSKI